MCCILLLPENYLSCLIELDSSLLIWCHCPCCNDCQVATEWLFSKSPLCDNVRGRVTHTTFFVAVSHCSSNSFSIWSLLILAFLAALSFCKRSHYWTKNVVSCHFIWNRIDSEQALLSGHDYCDHLWPLLTGSWLSWLSRLCPLTVTLARPHSPRPAWPPSCPCHTSNLTHRSVFYPDDIIDNLHVMCHNTMETGECNNPSVAPPGPHQLARAQ